MPQSITQRLNAAGFSRQQAKELAALFEQIRQDVETLRLAHNTHTHGGVTAGAGTSAVPGGSFIVATDGTALAAVQNVGTRK